MRLLFLKGVRSSIMVLYVFVTYVTYCFYVERSLTTRPTRRRKVTNAVHKRSVQVAWGIVQWYQGEWQEFVRV